MYGDVEFNLIICYIPIVKLGIYYQIAMGKIKPLKKVRVKIENRLKWKNNMYLF